MQPRQRQFVRGTSNRRWRHIDLTTGKDEMSMGLQMCVVCCSSRVGSQTNVREQRTCKRRLAHDDVAHCKENSHGARQRVHDNTKAQC
jgi:hypothetical protein